MYVKKQQLKLDMEQNWMESKLRRSIHQGCILLPCLSNLDTGHIMQNARMVEAQAGIKMPGEITITSAIEADEVVWYSHLLKNFPQFVVILTVKGFSVVSEAEVDIFLEFSCFFYDTMDVGNLVSSPLPFLNPACLFVL